MKKVQLTQEECRQKLTAFYETVAKKAGIPISDDDQFNCKKICVTKAVQDEISACYQEDGFDARGINQLFLMIGPKANQTPEDKYFAVIKNGFVIRGESDA